MTTDGLARYVTTREACDFLGYCRPDSFLRAWRARGLPLYQRPGGHYLVASGDVERFVRRLDSRSPGSAG
jgi:hypothetical protein